MKKIRQNLKTKTSEKKYLHQNLLQSTLPCLEKLVSLGGVASRFTFSPVLAALSSSAAEGGAAVVGLTGVGIISMNTAYCPSSQDCVIVNSELYKHNGHTITHRTHSTTHNIESMCYSHFPDTTTESTLIKTILYFTRIFHCFLALCLVEVVT